MKKKRNKKKDRHKKQRTKRASCRTSLRKRYDDPASNISVWKKRSSRRVLFSGARLCRGSQSGPENGVGRSARRSSVALIFDFSLFRGIKMAACEHLNAHENECPWGEKTCTWAAENGQLECLKYAHENGCPGSAEYARKYLDSDS